MIWAVLDVLARPYSAWATLRFDSWSRGWRSVLLSRWHQHPDVDDVTIPAVAEQMICVLLGGHKRAEVADGASWQRSAAVTPGAISMTAPRRSTRIRWRSLTDDPLDHLSLHLPAGTTERIVEELWDRDPVHFPFPDILAQPDPQLRQTMMTLLAAASAGVPDLYAESAAEFITVHALTCHSSLSPLRAYSHEDARVLRAMAYMRENLHLPLTLASIADEVSLSRYHFLRVFSQQTGETPHRYLTRLRVERACDELRRTAKSMTQIASRCGFAGNSQLAKAFRREIGLSPSAYRALHRPGRPRANGPGS